MRPRDVRLYLYDMLVACDDILSFVEGESLESYVQDRMLRSAVERQFQIIGEALKRSISVEPELAHRFPQAARVIGFRNLIVHRYDDLLDEIVWQTVGTDIVPLRAEVEKLLDERG